VVGVALKPQTAKTAKISGNVRRFVEIISVTVVAGEIFFASALWTVSGFPGMKNMVVTGNVAVIKKKAWSFGPGYLLHMNNFFRGKKTRKWVLTHLFQQFSNMADLTPFMKRLRRRTTVFRNVPYRPGGNPAHLLDVYQPKKRIGLLPVLIYIHGGGFTLCSKETHRGCALLFAHFGFLVFNVNYRLAPKHRYPAALEDSCYAYQWVVENAASYGGDTKRLSVAGESAGGNLALGLTIAACYERPEPYAKLVWETNVKPVTAQIIAGLLQVSTPQRFSKMLKVKKKFMSDLSGDIVRDVSKAYLGRQYKQHETETALSDPLVIIENAGKPDRPLPPIFAAVGTSDILHEDTARLEKALQPKTDLAEIKYYPDEPHVFHFMHWRKSAHRFWRDCKIFLNQHVL
jgi:acetyl esterase